MKTFNEKYEELLKRYDEGLFSTVGGWIDKGVSKVGSAVATGLKHVGSAALNTVKDKVKDIHQAGMNAAGFSSSTYKKENTPNLTENIINSAVPNKTLFITVGNVTYSLKYDGTHLIVTDNNKQQADAQTVAKITNYIKMTNFSNLPFSPDFNKVIQQSIQQQGKATQNGNV